jgi:hypothetical protein
MRLRSGECAPAFAFSDDGGGCNMSGISSYVLLPPHRLKKKSLRLQTAVVDFPDTVNMHRLSSDSYFFHRRHLKVSLEGEHAQRGGAANCRFPGEGTPIQHTDFVASHPDFPGITSRSAQRCRPHQRVVLSLITLLPLLGGCMLRNVEIMTFNFC